MKDTEQGIYTIKYPGYYEGPETPLPDEKQNGLGSSRGSPELYQEEVPDRPTLPMASRKLGLLITVLVGAIVVISLVVVESGLLPYRPAGFYCNDPSISFKFTGDTIGIGTLLSVTFIAPLFAIWAVEACNSWHNDYSTSKSPHGRTVSGLRTMWRWYKEYLVGGVAVLFVTDAAKLLIGEPRPHFFDTCQPDAASNCTTGGYVQTFTCATTSVSPRFQADASRSFPSGHTSISVFTCIFMVWFIHRRVSPNISYLLVPWLHCMCLLWAMVCSLTRITDHRHHWWDVLAGFFLGIFVAIYTINTFCNNFILTSRKTDARPVNGVSSSKDNTQGVVNGNRHQSVRRLLSSTSSYAGSISQEEKELREVPI